MNFMGLRGIEFGAIVIVALVVIVLAVDRSFYRKKSDLINKKLQTKEKHK